jgi:hypothetical protein
MQKISDALAYCKLVVVLGTQTYGGRGVEIFAT